ncbi:cytochrome c [Flavobacterium paronense]|uniref:C-type cytochrome n=1 Tax=Flavobacterium paronense TaxID=1392775 RepID=A0ABV5GC88_9FLAO|nr:cytochrome c [Flavobacterium paronense]MDN3677841.1 cytochrome c [Flavobacterium paronense]
MKYKVLALAVLSVIIYSCASKSSVPTTEVKKPETTVSAKPAQTVMSAELAEGKSLYENNCAKCHKLYDTKEFSSEEWKPIVASMQKKAHLDDLAGQKIYNYVTMN